MATTPHMDTAFDIGREVRAVVGSRRRHSPTPPSNGLVLDVGSGQSAHPRADLVVDKYAADDFERGSALDLRKPLVVGDGEALPFRDDAFDYVIASHVLEHAIDPRVFAGELSRVGQAGFVQVPSRAAELTFGWPFHPWLIDRHGDVLVFSPRGEAAAPVGDVFHHAYADSVFFRLWFAAHRAQWHHSVEWRERIVVEVGGSSRAPETATLDVERTLKALPQMGAQGPEGPLREALRCPVDRGSLREVGELLMCDDCARAYPQAQRVPVLLAEAAGGR